MDEEGID